ncbi:hypothetical protein T08_1913 [Trichinella sp. T8]|nr:hypothetical protein T08_1913 [Trichinella sp. T8]
MVRMNRAPDGATHTKVSLSFDYIADEETALLHHFQKFHVNAGQKMLLLITSTWTFQRFYLHQRLLSSLPTVLLPGSTCGVGNGDLKPTRQWTVGFALAAGQINYDSLTAILPTFVHERVTNKTKKQRTPVLFHESEHLSMETNEQRLSTTQTPTTITQRSKGIADRNRRFYTSSSLSYRTPPTVLIVKY